MFDKLKIRVDKLLYEKINAYGLLLYIGILSILFILFIIFSFICNSIINPIPFIIFLSVVIIFLQMNYNIYDVKLKKISELNLRTMEILERKYLNANLFTEEEKNKYLNTTLVDNDYILNKIVINEETFPLELREKILKQYNLLEYLCSLVQNDLVSREMFSILMDVEIKYWSSRLQLLKIVAGLKPNFLIEYLLNNKIIDKEYLSNIEM